MELVGKVGCSELGKKLSNAIVAKNRADKLFFKVLNNIKSTLGFDDIDKDWLKLLKDLCEPYCVKYILPERDIYSTVGSTGKLWYGAIIDCGNPLQTVKRKLFIDVDILDIKDENVLCAEFIKSNVSVINNFLNSYKNELEILIKDEEEKPHYDYGVEVYIQELRNKIAKVEKISNNIFPIIISEIKELEEN